MENQPVTDLNELMKRRLEELHELNNRNVETFAYDYPVTDYSSDILSNYEKFEGKTVYIAGRIMAIRRMGKASFSHLLDNKGKIQVYLRKNDIGEDNYAVFKLLDIGDIIGISGYVFTTKTGEISVHATGFKLLTKSMRPIPIAKETIDENGNKVVYDQFSDKELRYRQRYLDLIVNPDVKDVFVKRSKIIREIRNFLDNKGYIEVQTPVLQTLYGGASARPFITHHNALDMKLFLRIAEELYLKRLIVGGFEGVYELGTVFRNEGIDRTHNPEFSMLELYVAYKDYEWMMDFVEEMIREVVQNALGTSVVNVDGKTLDFGKKWKRISYAGEIKNNCGIDIFSESLENMKSFLKSSGVEIAHLKTKGQIIDELFETVVQDKLIEPTFCVDYPLEISPLAKRHRSQEGLVERFEGFILGREICNAFSELNDPIDQKERFIEQKKNFELGDDEAQQMDEDFIKSLEYGMPPTAGLGVGIDRLIMILTNQPSIKDVILFPHMRNK